MRIALEPARQPEVVRLVQALDAYQLPLYPPTSFHGIDFDALSQPNVLFAVARDEGGAAIGCGAIVLEAAWGELKRMYTQPQARGRGVARALLAFLEAEAMQRGCDCFHLETGYLQHEALRLYERCGYVRCGPFGSYTDDPHSVFMRKAAAPRAPTKE